MEEIITTKESEVLPRKEPDEFCNARKKSGGYCSKVAGYGTDHLGYGRCKFHGGSSLSGPNHPNWVHGKYAESLPHNILKHYDKLLQDGKLTELTEDLALVTAMIKESFEDLAQNHQATNEYFKTMGKVILDIRMLMEEMGPDLIPANLYVALETFVEVFDAARSAHIKMMEILTMIEQKRKLSESEQKRMMNFHTLFSAEDVMKLMARVLAIIKEEVKDIELQERIGEGIRREISKQRNNKLLPE